MPESLSLKKRHWEMLERAFTADSDPGNSLGIFQSKAGSIVSDLEAAGYIETAEARMGSGPLSMKVKGYRITQRGHIAYCNWAAEQPE